MNDYLDLLKERKLTLIMSLPVNDPELCRAAFGEGADVVKIHLNVHHRASGTHFGTLDEQREALEEMLECKAGPMGIVPGGSVEDAERDFEALEQMPFSFYSVYAHHIPGCMLGSARPLMAACDYSYSMDEISLMPEAGAKIVEASVIPGGEYGTRLNMRDLMKYTAIARSVGVPVVVPTQRAIRPEEVWLLSRAGVKAIMIGAMVTGKEKDGILAAIRAFRKAVDEVNGCA